MLSRSSRDATSKWGTLELPATSPFPVERLILYCEPDVKAFICKIGYKWMNEC